MRQSIKDKGLQMSLFTRDHLVFALQKHELGTKLQIIINLFMLPNFATTGCCKTTGQLWKPITDAFF